MDIDDFDGVVLLQVLAQLRNIYVHAAGIEVVVVYPDGLQGKVALQDFIGMCAEQTQQFRLLRCQFGLFLRSGKYLLLRVEGELANLIDVALLVLLCHARGAR